MKKGFERPSQKEVVASENGVNVVADIPTNEGNKEVGGVASKYVKYNEVVDASKVNCFKPTITSRVSKNFLNLDIDIPKTYEFDLSIVKMLSLRFRLKGIKKMIIDSLQSWVFNDINKRRDLQDTAKAFDAEYLMGAEIIKDVMFAHSKEKEFIAVLNKFTVVQDEVGDGGLISQMMTDPHFKINTDVIPTFVKMLAKEPFEVKHYGEELVVVLDINKVMSNIVIKSIVVGEQPTQLLADYVKLGNTIYANGYVNTVITVDGNAPAGLARFGVNDENFVCGRFQFTHQMFRDSLVGLKKDARGVEIENDWLPLSSFEKNKSADLVFVRTADLAGQQSGAEALKIQMAGLPSGLNYSTIPLIKISKAKFTIKSKPTGNALLDSLMSNSTKVQSVDSQAILSTYKLLLDGKVFSFNVGMGGGRDLCVLPNYRNLVALALFGADVLRSKRLPKIDISDNGQSIAVAASI